MQTEHFIPYAFRDVVIDGNEKWSGVIDMIDDQFVHVVHAQATKKMSRPMIKRIDRERFDYGVRTGRYMIFPCA